MSNLDITTKAYDATQRETLPDGRKSMNDYGISLRKTGVFRSTALISLGAFFPLGMLVPLQTEAKTNFVLFIADDCTHTDLGCYGGQNVKTPNIDRLAAEGVRFTRCFQSAPMCSPTRHNLYTGMYPTKTGAYPNHTFAQPGTRSVVQYLKPEGYRVALAGKRHIAPQEIFDFEYLGAAKNLNFDLVDRFLADASQKKDPFCLFLCSHEPHTPWNKGNPGQFDAQKVTLPPFWVDTRETREDYCKYLAEIEYMDGEVGKALTLLEKHGLADETVFIFTSEQGNSFPFAKWTCYNSGLHTAFVVRWPGVAKPGTTTDCLTDYSDVVPTFLDIAGVKLPGDLDGQSLASVLSGQSCTAKKYSFALHTTRGIIGGSDFYGIRSISDGHYRYIVNLTPGEEFRNAVTEGKSAWWDSWLREAATSSRARELIYNYQHRPAVELYDDLKDPFNLNNLAQQPAFAAVQKKLDRELRKWMRKSGDKGQATEMEALEHQVKGNAEE